MNSGIKCSSDCEGFIGDMEKREAKTSKKYDYLIMKIVDKGGEIRKEGEEVLTNKKKDAVEIVEFKELGACAAENPDHDEEKKGPVDWFCFSQALKSHNLAWGLAYFDRKLLLVYYTDEGFSGLKKGTQNKMTYSATLANVKQKCNFSKYIEAQELSDLTHTEIKKQI